MINLNLTKGEMGNFLGEYNNYGNMKGTILFMICYNLIAKMAIDVAWLLLKSEDVKDYFAKINK